MKQATNKEALDWAAVFIVSMALGALGLIVIFNHSLAIVLSPLVVLIPLYYLIKWAAIRTYRMWQDREVDRIVTRASKGVMALTVALLLPVAPAKALDDDLAGGYAGIYTKVIAPNMSAFWQVWWFNVRQTFEGQFPTPAPWDQTQKDHESGR